MTWTSAIGFVAAICTTFSLLPQALRIIKLRETRDISLLMYILLTVGLCLWFVYGVLIWSFPIMLANGISLIFTTVVLSLKIKYG